MNNKIDRIHRSANQQGGNNRVGIKNSDWEMEYICDRRFRRSREE